MLKPMDFRARKDGGKGWMHKWGVWEYEQDNPEV
jgi:hypothetical protein